MAFALFSFWRSSAAYRARIALALKGLDYKVVPTDLGNKEEVEGAYKEVNPQGKVPTLKHDDFVLPQSLAIVEYLEDIKPEPSLLPADPKDRAIARAMAEMIACDVHPLNNNAVLQYLRHELNVEKPAITDWYFHWLMLGFRGVETLLERHKHPGRFAFEDRPTIFEIFLVPQLVNARLWDFPLDAYPNMLVIEAACREHDAFTLTAPPRQPDAPPGVEL